MPYEGVRCRTCKRFEAYSSPRTLTGELTASSAYLLYNFDFDLNLMGVGTYDGYDLTSDFHYTNGMIDEYPDYRYFESYREKLLYWDGEGFVSINEYQAEQI